jgi:hypothetical protein
MNPIQFNAANYPSDLGDFKFRCDNEMNSSAYNTITRENMWNYLFNFVLDENKGFLNTKDTKINELMTKIDDDFSNNHSGYSLAITMRTMHSIAKNGLFEFQKMQNC